MYIIVKNALLGTKESLSLLEWQRDWLRIVGPTASALQIYMKSC
jgi:hypothetical protein